MNAIPPALDVSIAGYPHAELRDDQTAEEQLAVVQGNAISALQAMSELNARFANHQRECRGQFRQLDAQVEAVEDQATEYTRRLVVDGIPLAIFGLCLTGVGLTVQAVGSLVTC